MKKALQKIATVALVIVGFLVTLFLLLVTLGAFDFAAYIDGNRVVHSLVIVLAIIYTVLGVYLVIEIFAGDSGLSTMVLYSDNMNAVSTTSRVVRRLVRKAAKSLDKYFKNVKTDPENNLGIIRIAEDGTTAQLLWGYKDGGKFTSELPAHLMSHMARLSVDKDNRVVIHSHPTNTLAMNYVHELDEKKFTHTLWEMCTECIVVFPDGVGILPWMLCGTNEIGEATAEKMEEFRLVIWAMHGIYGAGKTLDETFGLIETVKKAAQIYMLTAGLERKNTIKDEDMIKLAEFFKGDYRKDFLNI